MLRNSSNNSFENDIDKFSKDGIHAIAIAKIDIETEQAIELNRIL